MMVPEIKDNANKEDKTTASFSELFSNATMLDYVYMVVGIIGGLITGLSLPFFNVLFGRVLDALNGGTDSIVQQVNVICIAFVCVAVVNFASGFCQVYFWCATGERQAQKFRIRYVNSILSQEIGWFDSCGAGELSTRVAELTGKLQDGLGRKVGDLVQYAAQVVGSFIVGFYLCWQLTVVLLASFPVIATCGAFMINAINSFQNQSLGQYAAAGGLATESLGAIRTVTALNAQPDIISRYRVFLFKAMNVGIMKGFKVGLGNGMVFAACFFTYALGFWYGATLVARSIRHGCSTTQHDGDCVSGGTILAVFFAVIMGSMALGQLAPPLTAFFTAKAAAGHMMKTISRKPLIDGLSEEGLTPEQKSQGSISLSAVNFAYPTRPDIMVCNNYNLSIAPGETVALVGASGCGKSTIINLLLRFYDPMNGEVMLDGRDIKTLNIRWLRSQIGYVGQEPVLFSGTVGDNIAYGIDSGLKAKTGQLQDSDIRAQVVEAAKLANAHDFIMEFPDGYDTDVGSNGVAMSGGQKQRIAIARALIKKPAVLLLDEATSALDAASERIVQASIDALQKRKAQTTVAIAHRLGTIRNADKICVISSGSIVETGTHDELYAANGLYADLFRLQMTASSEEGASNELTVVDVVDAAPGDVETKDGHEKRRRSVSSVHSAAPVEPAKPTKGEVVVAVELSKQEASQVSKKIWALMREHPLWLCTGCVGAAVFGAIFPVWGLLLSRTQDMFYLNDQDEMVRRASTISIYYVLMAIGAFFSATLQFTGIAEVGERISCKLRSELFEAIMRREVAYFDQETNNIGTLTTRLSDDSRIMHKAFGEGLAKQLQAITTLSIGLLLGFLASWRIALVVLATFPVNIIASSIQMAAIAGMQYDDEEKVATTATKAVASKGESKESSQQSKAAGGASGGGTTVAGGHGAIISSAFTHMRTVSAFSMQHKVMEHYDRITSQISRARSHRSLMAGLGFGGSNCSLFLTYALLFWYGAQLITKNQVTFVDMMQAILTLMLGALGLGQALNDFGDQKQGLQAAARIFQSIEESKLSPIDGLSTEGQRPAKRAVGRIQLKNVTFRYPTRPDVEVCKGYNLTIESGEMVALVGPSGSGKSTIINLLLRFYDPLEGEVLLDGTDIRQLNVRWLRSQIGYVGQEPVLFAGSVAENVGRGRASMEERPLLTLQEAMRQADQEEGAGLLQCKACCWTRDEKQAASYQAVQGDVEMGKIGLVQSEGADEDIVQACTASNAHAFIAAFPQGYLTDVGEGSMLVSGGQKQRIAIARALVKKPAVLLLDEATSALDANSEKVVQESIDALQRLKEQTTIVIAHRLSTIRGADKIVVVDAGRVVQVGTHDELLAASEGLYAELWAKQSGATAVN